MNRLLDMTVREALREFFGHLFIGLVFTMPVWAYALGIA